MSDYNTTDMIAGVWRIKWWKYRYVLVAVLLLNLLLVRQFLVHDSPDSIFSVSTTPESPTSSPQPPKSSPESPISSAQAVEQAIATSSPDLVPYTPSPTFSLDDYDFYGPYIGWPLQRVCNETTWRPGLVFVCDNNSGGIGNIRNFILTCLRYAIDAGATGITMPRIQRRSEKDLSNIFTTGFQPFDYFFDEQHFRDAMNTQCPQITIYHNVTDVPVPKHKNITLTQAEEFYPKDLGDNDGCDGRGVNRHLDMFRPSFDNWLKTYQHIPTKERPLSVRLKWATFFEWPIYRDGPEFAATFGDILRIRPDIRTLAAKTLWAMSYFMEIQPSLDKYEAKYLGVHLRTESDALDFWPDFREQTEGYLEQAETYHLTHAYLATGNATHGHRFAEKAWDRLKMKVVTKMDLLRDEDYFELRELSWDQQALVDFLVLTKSAHFTGCSFSSFAMNIAVKRHLLTEGLRTRQWKSPGDPYSTLVGRFKLWFGDWMFMLECMWP